ncbi:unnamed protein product, partial [Durusdinium trenchii]
VKDLLSAPPAEMVLIQHSHLAIGQRYIHADFDQKVFTFKTMEDQAIFHQLFVEPIKQMIAAKKGQVFSDYLEAYVQTIVPEACLERSGSAELSFSLHPSGVYTSKKVKKGDLQLYPLGIAQLVKAEYVGKIKGIRLKYEGIRFQLSTYKQLSSF